MGLFGLLRALKQTSPAALAGRVEAVHARVSAMSVDAAEAEVRDCVMMGDPFRATAEPPTTNEAALLHALPSTVQALFTTYRDVEAGGMRLARSDIGVFVRDPAYHRIGVDLEHADVVVRQRDGHVFVIEDDGQPQPDLSDEYPSVWHYLLEVAEHTRYGPTGR